MEAQTHTGLDSSPTRKLASDARSTIDRIEDAAPRVRERIEGLVESGRQHVRDFRHDVQDDIREKPVQSFLIAAGVGAIIGLLVGRSRR